MTTLSLLAIDTYKLSEATREEERLREEDERMRKNLESAKARLNKALGIVPELQWNSGNIPEDDGPFIFKVSDLIFEVRSTRYTSCEVFLRTGKCPVCGEHLTRHLSLVYFDDLEEAKKRNLDEIGGAIVAGPDKHKCPAEVEPPVVKPRTKNYEEQIGERLCELVSDVCQHLGVKWED